MELEEVKLIFKRNFVRNKHAKPQSHFVFLHQMRTCAGLDELKNEKAGITAKKDNFLCLRK